MNSFRLASLRLGSLGSAAGAMGSGPSDARSTGRGAPPGCGGESAISGAILGGVVGGRVFGGLGVMDCYGLRERL